MARLETEFRPQDGPHEAGTTSHAQGDVWQGFPTAALEEKPGHERQYPLDRIERIIGSIM